MLGMSVLALALVLFRLLAVRWKIGAAMLVVLGASFLCSAFRTDYATARGEGPDTWNGVTHAAGLTVVIPAAVAAMFALATQFRRDERWRPLAWPSLIAAVATLASLVATLAGGGNLFFYCFLALVLVWLSFVSTQAFSLIRSPEVATGATRA